MTEETEFDEIENDAPCDITACLLYFLKLLFDELRHNLTVFLTVSFLSVSLICSLIASLSDSLTIDLKAWKMVDAEAVDTLGEFVDAIIDNGLGESAN